MDNETKIELLQHLNRLDKAQMKYVYSRLLIQVETEEPVLTEEELEKRTKQAKFMIQEVANELEIKPAEIQTEENGVVQFLVVVAESSPEYAQMIQNILHELEQQSVKLDFGLTTFAVSALVVAIATAIIRPRIIMEKRVENTKTASKKETKIVLEARGVKEIAAVVQAALPFLHSIC